MIGYVQFFSHLPALLVGLHVFGAAMVWSTALWFHHGLCSHPVLEPEPGLREPGEALRSRGGSGVAEAEPPEQRQGAAVPEPQPEPQPQPEPA